MIKAFTLTLVFMLVAVPVSHAADTEYMREIPDDFPINPIGITGHEVADVELADSQTIIVDWSRGKAQHVTLGGDRDFVFLGGVKGSTYVLIVTQDNNGSRTPKWPNSVTGAESPILVLAKKPGMTNHLGFYYDGSSYRYFCLYPG